ncbi:MAG: type I methionyl aminopeptidase [Bacillota bacterium]|nr:type I methionyl aminopeptidase [Bacillota bacterium]
MIHLRSESDIAQLARAGRIVALVLERMGEMIRPGISTLELDQEAERLIRQAGARPAFLGYGNPPFPASICASPEEVVVHGIPSRQVILQEGEIISIDVGAELDGWYGDAARTFAVGEISAEKQRLIRITREAFYAGMDKARPGNRLGDVSAAIQAVADRNGLGVVRDLTGHFIGREMHEEPSIPNFGRAGRGPRLAAGMILAIEPMFALGGWQVTLDPVDEWTIRTRDKSPAAHYENTIAITEEGPLILSRL